MLLTEYSVASIQDLKYAVLDNAEITQSLVSNRLFKECMSLSRIGKRNNRATINSKLKKCRRIKDMFWHQLEYQNVNILDSENKPVQSLPIVFTSGLNDILNNPRTAEVLKSLSSDAKNYYDGFDLMESVWARTEDFELSLMILASVFQDTSASLTPVHYARRHKVTSPQTIPSSDATIRLITDVRRRIQDTRFGHLAKNMTKLIPINSRQIKQSAFYHFYVAAYSSLKLAKMGLSKQEAFLMPFLFNNLYEYFSINPKYFFVIPEKILQKHSIDDIYLGYCGAMWGLQEECLDYNVFTKKAQNDWPKLYREIYSSLDSTN